MRESPCVRREGLALLLIHAASEASSQTFGPRRRRAPDVPCVRVGLSDPHYGLCSLLSLDTYSEPHARADFYAHGYPNSYTKTYPNTNSGPPNPNVYTDPDRYSDSHSNSHFHSQAYPNADAHRDVHTDTYSNTCPHGYADTGRRAVDIEKHGLPCRSRRQRAATRTNRRARHRLLSASKPASLGRALAGDSQGRQLSGRRTCWPALDVRHISPGPILAEGR